ncbi:aminotransferase class I/II-fold pyridoxal phosphate-dependent enzyme [Cytobacillus depressus]|uniref:Aminotransferase class I/II-fold pyridoxal phosphate-dependent enzyme n=1 Tax=Cytobacillus depressus TaxID=1602942 RepID=A0A6L3V8P5_9BACI|nr:LL-diaminopimelate aminotransferase [Cytobacillus depressus]KAB2336811.1 aminotransferase class I/II-fold pyridoxal phosphate-dependent enzyme [Cytobacillus depressus]
MFGSKRVASVPPYLFTEINRKKEALIESGVDLIDLGVGDPDKPTPKHIIENLFTEMSNAENMKYPSVNGCTEFRVAVADFYQRQFNVDLDPDTEVLALIGSKEGLAHLIPSLLDPGDYLLTTDPCFTIYPMATYLANANFHAMPLTEKNNYQPNFFNIPKEILEKSKLMILNYPNNPTSATVDVDFFNNAVEFGKKHRIPIANDSAYNMISFGDYKAPSILQADGAKDIAVEIGTLSKTYNMTGWRIGYIVGNKDVIGALRIYKGNTDTGQFTPIQKAAAFALQSDQSLIDEQSKLYEERLEMMVNTLNDIGMPTKMPKATVFVWSQIPEGFTSSQFAEMLLVEAGVLVVPGTGFGPFGEGYVRISSTVPTERIKEALKRMKELLKKDKPDSRNAYVISEGK